MKITRKFITLTSICLSAFLFFGCSSSDVEGDSSTHNDSSTENEFESADQITEESTSPAIAPVPNYQTYSDSYVSFEYDTNLFECIASEQADSSTVYVTCPSMPTVSKNMRNTQLGFCTVPNPGSVTPSEFSAKLALGVLTKSLSEGMFPLEEGESIIDESSTYSNLSSEYYMELSDSSKCYVKALNYNDYITVVIMCLCEYSEEYNDSFMQIYNSAKSVYGSIDISDDETTQQDNVPTETSEPTPTPEPAATPEPTPTPEPTATPDPTPTVTSGQKNALKTAKDYLNYTAFSYDGLIGQLEYEGYTTDEAIYAVDNCGADWNEQALLKAKDYLDYSSFSYKGLIDQLEYEGFSSSEATYAVDNCGADWNEQAANKAKDYLSFSSFSKNGLIDQLKYEGFTHDQAVYGAEANGL